MEGHAVHDDAFYVPKVMFERWAESDPVERYRSWLQQNAEMRDDEETAIIEQVKSLLNESLRRADESPMPTGDDLLDGVYAEPEELETPHHK
jgi:TPP-dependent pyruvate/acetoin dehydrogenase alpha subunit